MAEGDAADRAIERRLEELTGEAGAGRTRHIRVGEGVIEALPAWLAQQHPDRTDVVVCDPSTAEAAGRAVVARLRSAGRTARLEVIEPQHGHDELVCDDEAIERLVELLRREPETSPVACGSGTINDVVKMASARTERTFQCVATAASMNGYTSAIAAVLSGGVKRTLPAPPAEAIFADTDVVRRAPPRLNLAGFGDLLSKPYSNADWLLAHLVRGVPYDAHPARLLDDAYEALLDRASLVGEADPRGIGTLMRTILLSGFTMALAGTSAPASGGEHLVSHYWDMIQHANDRPLYALHGTQVGIATRMSAMLFERLVELDELPAPPDAGRGLSREDHPDLPADVASEVRAQHEAKQKRGAERAEELERVRAGWGELREQLRETLVPSERIAAVLAEAGAPDRPSAIGVEGELAVHTVRVCRQIRSRYVALDLLDELGLLHRWASEVVAAVEHGGGR